MEECFPAKIWDQDPGCTRVCCCGGEERLKYFIALLLLLGRVETMSRPCTIGRGSRARTCVPRDRIETSFELLRGWW